MQAWLFCAFRRGARKFCISSLLHRARTWVFWILRRGTACYQSPRHDRLAPRPSQSEAAVKADHRVAWVGANRFGWRRAGVSCRWHCHPTFAASKAGSFITRPSPKLSTARAGRMGGLLAVLLEDCWQASTALPIQSYPHLTANWSQSSVHLASSACESTTAHVVARLYHHRPSDPAPRICWRVAALPESQPVRICCWQNQIIPPNLVGCRSSVTPNCQSSPGRPTEAETLQYWPDRKSSCQTALPTPRRPIVPLSVLCCCAEARSPPKTFPFR